ncbi:MAG TPA: nucleotide exchange factor GrpE [Miltoncostaea sp.]|nr:nucleotide exchange factor GrpE [Miltoncostaea sp.]
MSTGAPEDAGAAGAMPEDGDPREGPAPPVDLEARLARTEDRLLRALADLDNLRKRVARDLERERLESHRRILGDWLEVADSADRALEAFGPRTDDPLAAGLAALGEQIADVLRRQGVVRIGAAGEPFDPELHEAVGTTAAPDRAKGTVAGVVRPGYALDGGLLRPAQVIVASGGAGEAP